jgi:arylsulfatase
VQYYEMIASRALWVGRLEGRGRKRRRAAPITDEILAAQKWELYHVAEDFAECEDLAEQHPGQARRTGARDGGSEAAKYNVLPLDSRMQLRMGERKPSTIAAGNATSTCRAARRSSSTRRST